MIVTMPDMEKVDALTQEVHQIATEDNAQVEAYLAEMESVGGKEFADSLRKLLDDDEADGGDRFGAALQLDDGIPRGFVAPGNRAGQMAGNQFNPLVEFPWPRRWEPSACFVWQFQGA